MISSAKPIDRTLGRKQEKPGPRGPDFCFNFEHRMTRFSTQLNIEGTVVVCVVVPLLPETVIV